jgi:hypothetical protein
MSWTDELSNRREAAINQEEEKRRAYQRQFDSVNSMVLRNLYEVGEALWGRTFYGRRKCKAFADGDHWTLIERKEFNTDRENTKFVVQVKINPQQQCFSISAYDKSGWGGQNESSKDLSEEALRKALINRLSPP